MPKLIIPDEKIVSTQGAERSIQGEAAATASAAKLGELQANDASQAQANRAKIGTIMRTQAAEGLADSGRQIGDLIGKDEASAAAAYAQIGNTAMEAGQSVIQQGKNMFDKAMNNMSSYVEKAKGAVEDGVYNNTYSAAAKEFNQRVMDRMGKPYDDNGNPTFASLSADIGAISEDVKAKYSGQLGGNPDALQRFDNTFTTMSTNQQIGAMKEARNQQIEYSKGSLENFLNTNAVSALSTSDRSTLPTYIAAANERIDSAYKNGYIAYEQAVQLKDKARHDINYGSIENLAQKNPNEAYDLLGMEPGSKALPNEQLGITPTERARLVDVTAKRITAQRAADRTRVAEEKALVKEQQNFHKDNLDLGIAQGVSTDADIDAAYNDGKISHSQMVNLKEKVISNSQKGLNKAQTRQAISNDINSGKLIGSKYGTPAINDHYNSQIESTGASELFDTKQPMDRARLAAQYRAPVTNFTNELDSIAKGGSTEQIMQAAQAYKYVSSKSPIAVSKLNKQSSAFYNTINSQLKYGNVDPQKAIERAQTLVFDAKEEDYRIRRNEVDNKESPFSAANVDKTISDMNWGDEDYRANTYSNLNHTFGPNDKISQFAKLKLTNQLRDAYIITGSYEAAKTMVESESQGVFGTSGMNNMSNWTRDNSVLMFAPPEATYGPGTPTNYSTSEMRANLDHDVAGLLVKGPYADQSQIKPEQILVGSGEFTARQVGNAKYSLYYIDDNGVEHPVVNPNTGQAQFWAPDQGYISDYRMNQVQDQFNKAQKVQDLQKAIDENSVGGYIKKGIKAVGSSIISDVNAAPPPGSQGAVVRTALSFVGVNEHKDREALGRVMTRMIGQSVDPSTTPWCAAFVNTVLRANGQQGTGSLAARSFLNWGRPTNNPQQGDIVVMSRGGDTSKGHVGFYMGRDSNGNILVLGGNQGDAVNIKAVNPNSILGARTMNPNRSEASMAHREMSFSSPNVSYGEDNEIGTTKYSVSPNEVVGYRMAPSGEECQQLFQSGPLSAAPNKALPVGVRQNNPGNIVKTGSRWQGEVPSTASRFKEFASPEDGIGAIVNNLRTSYLPKGYNTIEKIVRRWTATQKDWPSYIKNLSEATGLKPGEKFDIDKMQPRQLVELIKGIIKQENGYNPYPDSVIMNGILRGQ